jgi:hypothetical protein
MTSKALHIRASYEWNHSAELRSQYPTFVYYWREKYERVYRIELRPQDLVVRHH